MPVINAIVFGGLAVALMAGGFDHLFMIVLVPVALIFISRSSEKSRCVRYRTEREMVMDLIVDLYWSFRSAYSYVVLPRIIELREGVIDLRIVHPAAIRNPSYFERMDPLARPYFLKDSARAWFEV